MNTLNYYPNVQQRYLLEGEHDGHKCDSTKNLAVLVILIHYLF